MAPSADKIHLISGKPFNLIDTPGLSDPREGADTRNITNMIDELKKANNVHLFLIAFNGSEPRFDESLKDMLKIFVGMFGQKFLEKNTIFEVTNWHFDPFSLRARKRAKKDEDSLTKELNRKLKELVRQNF